VKRHLLMCMTVMTLGMAALPASPALAQEAPKTAAESKPIAETKPRSVYRLDFVVRELEGEKTINSRSYMIFVREGALGKIRMGSSLPVQTNESNFTNSNVDVNIDCRLAERETGVLLDTMFELASFVAVPWKAPGPDTHPILRRFRFEGQPLVTPGKPTIIGKLDDVGTNHRFEIEVTATKVK
jgi:hypothetical protein